MSYELDISIPKRSTKKTPKPSDAKSKPDKLPQTTVNMTTVPIDKTIHVDDSTTGSTLVSNLTVSHVARETDALTESTRGASSETYRTEPTVTSSRTSQKASVHSRGRILHIF